MFAVRKVRAADVLRSDEVQVAVTLARCISLGASLRRGFSFPGRPGAAYALLQFVRRRAVTV
jgi:hypothetical protein